MDVGLNRDSKWWAIASVIILLVAFAARMFWLDRRPLWWDEGNNVYFAHQSPLALAIESHATNDTDPPGHRLTLGAWRTVAGSSPFAMRFFSVWMGVVIVALTWAVGRWLTNARITLLATLLVALSPMQIHYAREAKGYAVVSVCALLSTYAWGRRLGYFSVQSPRCSHVILWWAVYVFSTAMAVGTHYYVGLLILWQGVWVVTSTGLAWARGRIVRRDLFTRLKKWALAMGAVALLLAPWVWVMFGVTVRGVVGLSSARGDALSMGTYLSQIVRSFGAGPGAEGVTALVVSGGLVVLSIIGALSGGKRTFLLTWVAVPLAAAYLIQTAYSFFFPRFLLYIGPPFYILVSRGIAALRLRAAPSLGRRLAATMAAVLIAVIIGMWVFGLARAYVAPVDEAEDARPAIARVRAIARPDDAFVYGYIWQAGYLYAYYPQNKLKFYRSYYTPQTVGPELESIFASHPRLWLFNYDIAAENVHNLPGSWLEENAYKAESGWYGRNHLALYLAPDFQTPGVGPEEETVAFDGRVELRHPLVKARLRPGDVIALPLHWQALAPLDENYNVFVHLGLPGAPPLAQSDGPPWNGSSPTSEWAVGQKVLDRRALLLPDTLPPGRYQVLVGLYRSSDGSRLPVGDTDNLDTWSLGSVEVVD